MHAYSTNSPAPPKHIAYLMLASVAVSAGIGSLVKYANAHIGWTLGGVSTMAVFSVLYFAFDRVVWKWVWARRILLVPDLNGRWLCAGRTAFKGGVPQEYLWQAEVTIKQSWSKITIRLKTGQSSSESIAASIYREPGNGYRLIYHYDNKPKVHEQLLARHCGLCNLLFTEDLTLAEGEYFTDKDRLTAGTMRLSRGGSSSAQT